MKTRADRILLAVLLVSAVLYAAVLISELGVDVVDPFFSADRVRFLLIFHAVPVFCLQLLLCRNVKWILIRLLPLLLELLAVWVCVLGMLGTESWDSLGWAMLLWLTFAPAAGIALGWAVYGVQRFCRWVNK